MSEGLRGTIYECVRGVCGCEQVCACHLPDYVCGRGLSDNVWGHDGACG